MGAIVGVVIGYVLGTRDGSEGMTELREAWRTISTSDEVRDRVGGGWSLTRQLVRRALGVLADGRRAGEGDASLRRAA